MIHPSAYTEEEQAFLDNLRAAPVVSIISAKDFDRLSALLGRVPTYEINTNNKLNLAKPITLNSRFLDTKLADAGFENLMLYGRPFVRG